MQPEGWALSAGMPCRPASAQRHLPACTVQGQTYGLASAQLTDPAAVAVALQALGQAARANIAGQVLAQAPAQVKGMTPHAQAQQWLLAGQLPNGAPVRLHSLVFAHGLRVYQASLLGPQADDATARDFFERVEVRP
jgi:hypothetical protein